MIPDSHKNLLLEKHKSLASEYSHDTPILGWYDAAAAMSEYAKGIAIDFIDFAASNRWYRNGKLNEWYQIPKQADNKTTEQLFELYLSSQNKLCQQRKFSPPPKRKRS
jgi:hypothetical protein